MTQESNKHHVQLSRMSITRSGDKGDISNIGVIAFTPEIYAFLKTKLTAEIVRDYFKGLVHGEINVYPMDNIEALQIVMKNALGGGATKTMRFDQTGKSMGSLIQYLELSLDDGELAMLPDESPFSGN